MKIVEVGNKFILDCNYSERHFPKQAGFKWDSETKKWWTDDIEKCKALDCKVTLAKNLESFNG